MRIVNYDLFFAKRKIFVHNAVVVGVNDKDKVVKGTVSDYRECFSTDAGQRVLANMLTEGGFFKVLKTPEDFAIENFLKIVLNKTGGYPVEGKSSKARIESYVRSLLNMKIEY